MNEKVRIAAGQLHRGGADQLPSAAAALESAVERLMAQVDYYLHCELDDEYDHEQPASARRQLEMALRQELLRASAIGMASKIG